MHVRHTSEYLSESDALLNYNYKLCKNRRVRLSVCLFTIFFASLGGNELSRSLTQNRVPCRHVLALYISVKYPDRVRGHIKLPEHVQEEEESVWIFQRGYPYSCLHLML